MAFPNRKHDLGGDALLDVAYTLRAKISNRLIESFIKQNNIIALKLLFYIAKYDLPLKLDQELQHIVVDLNDLCNTIEVSRQALRANIKRMQRTVLTFEEEDGDVAEDIVVVPKATYYYAKNKLELTMFTKVVRLIAQVRRQFTTIDTRQIFLLKNKHSVRMLALLELIKNYQQNVAKRRHLTLEELNLFFGTNYKRLAEIERKILEPVKEELDQTAKTSFIWEKDFEVKGKGRPKAVGVVIDVVNNTPQGRFDF